MVKGHGELELDKIILEKNVLNFCKDIDNNDNSFEDTIAILKNLDLFITSDTAIAHLASTMEIKTPTFKFQSRLEMAYRYEIL